MNTFSIIVYIINFSVDFSNENDQTILLNESLSTAMDIIKCASVHEDELKS